MTDVDKKAGQLTWT